MRRRVAAAAVVVLGLVAAGAPGIAAAAESVRSGTLVATVGDDGGLRFTGPDGTVVLDGGRADLTTTLGTRYTATGVAELRRDGGAVLVRWRTDDPQGRALVLRARPDREGVIALELAVADDGGGGVAKVGLSFSDRRSERFLGFGERSNAVDQRGHEVENFVAEGPYQPEERPFIAAVVPPQGFHPRDDAAHYPVPWMVSTAGYGVLIDSDETSTFTLGDRWRMDVEGPRAATRVIAGPTPAMALRRFTSLTGRQPAPAAPWFLGVWFMPNDFDTEDVPTENARLQLMREKDVPVSVAETTMQELPCGDARRLREVSLQRAANTRAAGMAILAYAHSMVCVNYPEVYEPLRDRGLFVRGDDGNPYIFKSFADRYTQVVVALIDWTAGGAREAWADVLGRTVADGYDGWMEDYGEYAPPEGHYADGVAGSAAHNRYATDYHCGSYAYQQRAGRPLAVFSRSGWRGSARCSPLVWSGDPTADWGYDGLESAVFNGLNMGLSGVGFWASELGGLFELGVRQLTPELLQRWIQFGAVSPWMKARKKRIGIPDKGTGPQVWDPEILPVFRRYAKLHTQLYPYLAAAAAEYRRSGMPLMRHLALAFPQDAESLRQDREFLLGPDLLAAPVLAPGQRERPLYVPPGRWVDLWRAVRYDGTGDGGLTLDRRARLLPGRTRTTLPAPLDELPLLVRAGAVLPLLPADVDTLTDRGARDAGGRPIVRYADRRGRLELLAFPRGRSSARFDRDGRITSVEGRGGWTLRVRARGARRVALQASLATLRRPFRPCRVLVGGRALARTAWRYEPRTAVLRVRFRARAGGGAVVRVRRCGRAVTPPS